MGIFLESAMKKLTEVKDVENFEELYKWICSQKIDSKDRRILYEMTDKVCELNFKHLQTKGYLNTLN